MNIEKRADGKVTILSLPDEFTLGMMNRPLREAIQEALDAGELSLVIDMTHVLLIDSPGVGDLVRSYSTVKGRGGHLKLSSVNPMVYDVLNATRVSAILEIHGTEAEAVASFG